MKLTFTVEETHTVVREISRSDYEAARKSGRERDWFEDRFQEPDLSDSDVCTESVTLEDAEVLQ